MAAQFYEKLKKSVSGYYNYWTGLQSFLNDESHGRLSLIHILVCVEEKEG